MLSIYTFLFQNDYIIFSWLLIPVVCDVLQISSYANIQMFSVQQGCVTFTLKTFDNVTNNFVSKCMLYSSKILSRQWKLCRTFLFFLNHIRNMVSVAPSNRLIAGRFSLSSWSIPEFPLAEIHPSMLWFLIRSRSSTLVGLLRRCQLWFLLWDSSLFTWAPVKRQKATYELHFIEFNESIKLFTN